MIKISLKANDFVRILFSMILRRRLYKGYERLKSIEDKIEEILDIQEVIEKNKILTLELNEQEANILYDFVNLQLNGIQCIICEIRMYELIKNMIEK